MPVINEKGVVPAGHNIALHRQLARELVDLSDGCRYLVKMLRGVLGEVLVAPGGVRAGSTRTGMSKDVVGIQQGSGGYEKAPASWSGLCIWDYMTAAAPSILLPNPHQ